MILLGDLTATQRSLLAAGGAVLGAIFVALLATSDLDLTALRTLREVHVDGQGAVLKTRYNPMAFVGIALIAMAVLTLLGLIFGVFMRIVASILGGSSSQLVQAGQEFEQELAKVLAIIRSHIATNESYAKSLANAQTRLAGLPEAEQVRVIVSLLVAENERMRSDTSTLKSRLEDSHKQIQTLRSSLTKAEEIVLMDPLTGTGNRRQFDAAMGKAIQHCEEKGMPLSLIMCDIDHFKRVNDAFGHQVGDELIKMFARVIEGSVRDIDTVIRYGGEEFAIILPMTTQEEARNIAERIRHQFENKRLTIRETNQKIGQLTASFGVSQYRAGDDAEMFVQRADAKLYDAKSSGRNRVHAFGD